MAHRAAVSTPLTEQILDAWNAGETQLAIANQLAIKKGDVGYVVAKAKQDGLVIAGRTNRPGRVVLLRDKPTLNMGKPACGMDTIAGASFLVERKQTQCAWVIGDVAGAQTRCCGGRVTRGSYCAEHARLAYIARRDAPR